MAFRSVSLKGGRKSTCRRASRGDATMHVVRSRSRRDVLPGNKQAHASMVRVYTGRAVDICSTTVWPAWNTARHMRSVDSS